MKHLNALLGAAFAIVLPLAATAATVQGEYLANGSIATLTIAPHLANPVVGQASIRTDSTDVAGGSFTFLFQTAESAAVTGLGNVRRASGFTNLTASFAGQSIDLVSDGLDQLNFRLPRFVAMAQDSFALTFAYDAAKADNTIDFDIELAAVPVPAAGGLLLLALGGIAALRRRKAA